MIWLKGRVVQGGVCDELCVGGVGQCPGGVVMLYRMVH